MNRDNGKVNSNTIKCAMMRAKIRKPPFLYNLIGTHDLEWPSFTIQWLPDRNEPVSKNYSVQKIILGIHDDEHDLNYLMIAEVQIPYTNLDSDDLSNTDRFNNNSIHVDNIFKIIKKINHEGDVYIARYMPQKDSIIATKSDGHEVFIFDTNKKPSKASNGRALPELRLFGHETDGYGLSWSNFNSGHLLSGDYVGNICIWDINTTPNNLTLDPLQVFKVNEGGIYDIAWNPKNEKLFGSVGEKNLRLWDVRAPIMNNPVQNCVAHSKRINCLSFNPFKEWSVVTGSNDKTVKLWDTRKIGKSNDMYECVHTIKEFDDDVLKVYWNPNNERLFASGSRDRRVIVWDINKIGEKENDGCPAEMLFIHHGHFDEICDLSWNPFDDMMMASVDVRSSIHFWKMHLEIY
ncbi:WD-40 repeat-containing protein MSI1-like [Vicia villosa]|uniref:WD-40 repeat-containing protein MSI1-like n=1 Tax=Vicia villosa TaxID=3911 RepID=UPI00273CB887|nr:WD-40 repeat-containing protein MSI1-like [Vicia villosa]